jgi:hypothetical protein
VGHIVVFEGADRVPTYHRCEELADAVSFVEKLRNDRGVESAQIFRTEEVRFDFKPYYRVELGALGAGSVPAALATPVAPASPPPAMTPPPPITSMASPADSSIDDEDFDEELDEDDLSASGSRRGLFGR